MQLYTKLCLIEDCGKLHLTRFFDYQRCLVEEVRIQQQTYRESH